jgi:hypothetical protein
MFERLNEKSDMMEEKAMTRLENFETKHKVISEMTDEELEALKMRIESEEGILEQKKAREDRIKEINMRAIEARSKNLEKIAERIENSNMTEEEKELAKERLELQQQNFEEFKERKEQNFEMQEKRKEEAKERYQANSEIREQHREDLIDEIEEELEDSEIEKVTIDGGDGSERNLGEEDLVKIVEGEEGSENSLV